MLEGLCCYHPYSGVTNNCSESLNKVIKDLQSWKEAPIDSMLLSLYQLQCYFSNEIKWGLAGIGSYTLESSFSSLKILEVDNYINTRSPKEIVSSIRNSLLQSVGTRKEETPQPIIADSQIEFQNAGQSSIVKPALAQQSQSALARARLILDANKMSFDPKLHVFNVEGSAGVPRVVTLYPKVTCSCPLSTECYHILAVKLSIGMPVQDKVTRKTLTQLRRNTRKTADKKSGRKQPRKGDIDIPNGNNFICTQA